MTVAELIELLSRQVPTDIVYVGTPNEIAKAAKVENDYFEVGDPPAVVIECEDEP